ncbi:MAG TPA: hypothetical protein VFF67_10825, partial [Thermoplasmata archaeon]|nr:hypothetical protein [Thermoplasmata archaeon]
PSVGLGIGTGVFGEPITALEVAGLLLVILGVSLVFRERGTGRSDPSGSEGSVGRTATIETSPLPASPTEGSVGEEAAKLTGR